MRYLPFFIILVVLLSSCSNKEKEVDSSDNATSEITKQTDWTAGIISDSSKLPADTFSVVVAIRTAPHANYDRIVFEFSGAGIPNYHLEYVDKPVRACGSGKVVDLPGDGCLMIKFLSARMHHEGTSTIDERDHKLDFPIILRLVSTCDFENVVAWVAAVSTPNKYRLMELNNPPRLVVDIMH